MGVLGPTFWQWGSKCARTSTFSAVPWPVIIYPIHIVSVLPTAAEVCKHADFCGSLTLNISVNFIRLFDCINCIKIFGSGWADLPRPLGSPREGREERRIEGGRAVVWTPKIYDRLPPHYYNMNLVICKKIAAGTRLCVYCWLQNQMQMEPRPGECCKCVTVTVRK